MYYVTEMFLQNLKARTGSKSFPLSWWHQYASHLHQEMDRWAQKIRKVREQSCSSAGSASTPPQLPSNPVSDSLSPWQQLFVWGITNASLSVIQKKIHFFCRSPPDLICPAGVSPADMTWDGLPSPSRWQNSSSSGLWCPEDSSKCPLPSPPSSFSTHNPYKREGFGIRITRIDQL